MIAQQRLYRLHVPKLSGAPPVREPIWLVRDGFLFRHVEAAPQTLDQRESADVARLRNFLAAEARRGVKHTIAVAGGLPRRAGDVRDRLRRALHLALQQGHLAEMPLPEGERRGQKTH